MYVKTNLRYYHKFGQIHTDKTAAWFHQWIFLIWGLGPLWGGTPLTDKIRKVVFDLLPKGASTRILAKCTCPYAGLKFTSQRPRKHLVMMKMVVVVKELKVWYLYLYCFKFEYT